MNSLSSRCVLPLIGYLAKATGRTKTFYAREAIIEHLADLEDLYMAEQVVRRIRSGEEKASTLDDVGARLGLAN